MSNQLDRIEWKLDQIMASLIGAKSVPKTDMEDITNSHNQTGHRPQITEAGETLRLFTTKQQVALQMLIRGADNQEIADRMGVTINTAKVHVRTLARKLGVSTRSEIVGKCLIPMKEVADEAYMMMARGLPKDWDATYSEPDPCHELIHGADK